MSYEYNAVLMELLKQSPSKFAGTVLWTMHKIDQSIASTGAIRFAEALRLVDLSDSWQQLAVIDFLVEQKMYLKVQGVSSAGQHQILVMNSRGREQ